MRRRLGAALEGIGAWAIHDAFSPEVHYVGLTSAGTPVLANALILAASSATAGAGMVSLAVFALGLSLPMILFMVLYNALKEAFAWLRDHQGLLRRIGGILMIAYGVWLIVSTLV